MARKIQPRSKTPKPRPGQSSEEYWRERETRQRAANIHDEARYVARINSIFETVQDSIQQEIESFYQRYAGKEGIDIAEARRRVSKIDMEKYERLAAQYVKAAHEGGREAAFSDEANEQMRLYNATMRINRLEMLKARCGIRAMEGYRLADQLINEALEERAYSEYERLAGILGNTVQFNENMVRSIVNASYQNATWSQRLWNNQALLSAQIGAQLAQGILTGKGSDVLARNIQKLTGQSTYNCQRLMRTELRRVQTAAAEQSMEDNGVTAYTFMVANGVNPCDECVDMDGQVFKLSEMEVGKNAPPLHPSCHCCTAPALDEEKWQMWLDGPAQAGVSWEEFDENTPNKEIYFARGNNTNDQIDGIIKESKETPSSTLLEQLSKSNIQNKPVKDLENPLTSGEIIKKIHGVDRSGSCTSLALAYIGNRIGLDVKDLRGGDSADFFADTEVIKKITEMAGGKIVKMENDFEAVKILLKNVKGENEYFLSSGRHSAIVRKANRGYEYLRLQDGRGIGFSKLNNKVLDEVFKCTKTHTRYRIHYDATSMLFDINNLHGNTDFTSILGYLNTMV